MPSPVSAVLKKGASGKRVTIFCALCGLILDRLSS
jgi:hypothetical protein